VVTELVNSSASVYVDSKRVQIATPENFEVPPGGLNIRWPDTPVDQELRLHEHKIKAAVAFARANWINRVLIDGPRARFGIVTAGKSYLDVRQVLDEFGIDEKGAAEIGIRLFKVGMTWPLDPDGIRQFAKGLDEILVIEEKRSLLESQIKEILYALRHDDRPTVVGKQDETGATLLPSSGGLTPELIARALAVRLGRFHSSDRIRQRIAYFDLQERPAGDSKIEIQRIPYFCSGCPHNTSTRVPEGSRAIAGVGCHYMVNWMDRATSTFTHMGGEGATWLGQAPFTETPHVFQNLGDGTYFHSGALAIRAALAAKVNITFKILFNDAVAMTGGQPIDGQLTVPQLSRQLHAEGVRRITVVTDEPEKYDAEHGFAPGVTVHHRKALDRIQREFREISGTSVIIYDQACAAEKRRKRKWGAYPDPARRLFINELGC
jgi:indolepyruvate ferredoxin oxidoreductase